MNDALRILFFGLALLVCGGAGIFALLVAAERLCRWIADQVKDSNHDDPP